MRNGLTDHLRECYEARSGMSTYGLNAASRTPLWVRLGWERPAAARVNKESASGERQQPHRQFCLGPGNKAAHQKFGMVTQVPVFFESLVDIPADAEPATPGK